MPYCQQCDKTVDDGRYCPDCGSELVQPSAGRDQWGTERETGSDAGASEWGDPGETAGGRSEPQTARPAEANDGEDYFQKGPLGFALTYPVGDGWEQMLISAGLLFLAGLVIFPFVFVYGYAYRLGRAAIRGDHRPPEYGDWGGLFVDGLLVSIVGIPVFIAGLLAIAVPFGLSTALDAPSVVLLAIPLYLATLYVGGGVLPTFMATGSVTGTYSDLRFLEFVKTANYLKALVFGFLAVFGITLAMMLVFVVLLITVVGILLAFPLLILVQPFVVFIPFLLFAYFYRESMLEGIVPELKNESSLGAEF
ncbi:MAG: DUF4013 domain-containing protein [Natronomonas sp.]